MMKALKMGMQSLVYRKKQYVSLFLVCMLGVGVSLFCLFLIDGMLFALESKSKIYYGGDMTFIGGKNSLLFTDADSFLEKLEDVFPPGSVVSKRFDLDADYAAFYFEGTGVRQRVIKGIDFDKEQDLFRNFNYVAGNAEAMADSNGVLLSEPIAEMLNVRAGDSVTLMLWTAQGYTNTVQLVVQGIFRDSSLFGMYTSYMDLGCLLDAYGWPRGWANRICVSLPAGTDADSQIEGFQRALEAEFNMFPLVDDKQIFYDQLLSGMLPDATYALIHLSANLKELQTLIDAMEIIAAFVIVMLLVIIVVGVSSTYRVIVMKRINEIGIYMAIGMQKRDVFRLLLSETSILIASGCVGGFLLALLLSKAAELFNLSFIPAFDIFLMNGTLVPMLSPVYSLFVSAVVCVTTMLAVLFAVRKTIKVMPVKALGITE